MEYDTYIRLLWLLGLKSEALEAYHKGSQFTIVPIEEVREDIEQFDLSMACTKNTLKEKHEESIMEVGKTTGSTLRN